MVVHVKDHKVEVVGYDFDTDDNDDGGYKNGNDNDDDNGCDGNDE